MKGSGVDAPTRVGILLQTAREGSAEAFGQLVEHYEQSVFAFVVMHTRDRELAQELVQETFVRAYEGLARFNDDQSFIHWLLGIAHHVVSEWRRKKKIHQKALEAVTELGGVQQTNVTSEERAEPGELHGHILRAIAVCPENYHMPLTMRYLDQMTYEEIAEVLQLSPGQVKGMLYRGKQMLREKLVYLIEET